MSRTDVRVRVRGVSVVHIEQPVIIVLVIVTTTIHHRVTSVEVPVITNLR